MAGVFHEAVTGDTMRRVSRIQIARETGWTLEYIDGLSIQDWLDYAAVTHGLADLEHFRYGAA